MLRSTLPAALVASSAVVLATSVLPHGSAVVATVPAVSDGSPPAPAHGALLSPGSSDAGVVGAVPRPARAPSTRARWQWPLRPRPSVARPFKAPTSAYGAGHRGLDLAVADGTAVRAVEGGVVTHAGLVAGRGTVTVAHADGLRSTYEPVDPVVAAGDVVVTGEVLGTLRARAGPAHCGARTCLHLGARRGASYLDPYPLLAGGRLALLPLGR